jgi:hypothetical protein
MKRNKKASTRRMRFKGINPKPGNSRYARKRRWLDAQEEPCSWGFQIPEPKPWR